MESQIYSTSGKALSSIHVKYVAVYLSWREYMRMDIHCFPFIYFSNCHQFFNYRPVHMILLNKFQV